MSGRLGDLSEEQGVKLEQFRRNLQDIIKDCHDDHCLLRFLRAREFVLKDSEAMFRKAVAWRAVVKADSIAANFKLPEVCEKYWCGGLCGHDKEGRPIYISPMGKLDMKGLLHSCSTSELTNITIWYLEYIYKDLRNQSEKLGRKVEELVMINDFDGVGIHHLWKPGIDLFNSMLTLFEQFYPETIKVSYVLNAPRIFPILFSLVKPFLRERTRNKIRILGSNWKEVLRENINADNLPEHWGGSLRDPDGNPRCPSLVKPAGTVPHSYYIKDMRVDMCDTTAVQISRGSSHKLRLVAKKPNCVLRYEFMTKHSSVGFGVLFVDQDAKDADSMTDVLSVLQYNSHMVPESGELDLLQAGTYEVIFDNTASWTKNKTVTYSIQIVGDEEEVPTN